MKIIRVIMIATFSVLFSASFTTGQDPLEQSAYLAPFPYPDPNARTDEWSFSLEPLQTGIYNVFLNDGNAWGYQLGTPVPAPSMQPGYSVFALWAWRQTDSTGNSFVFEVVNTVWEEKKATVNVTCWWDPVAGEATGNSEGEAPGRIDGWAKGIANHLKGHLQLTELAILDPPDYLCINESLDLSAWVVRPEDFPWDFREAVDVEWEVTPSSSGTFVPSEGHSVTFTPLETGEVTITATVPGTDGPITESITITIVKVEIEEFDRVVPRAGNEKEVLITTTPSPLPAGASVALSVFRTSGNEGAATIVDPAGATITQTTTIKIRGAQQSWGSGNNAAPNSMELRATFAGSGSPCDTENFTICAHPCDFRQTAGQDAGNGVLRFDYEWDSDSGNDNDLDRVLVGEHVAYPNNGVPPDPPFVNWDPFLDPTVINVNGADGGLQDNHTHCGPGESMTAGPAATYTGTQNYRYHCNRCMPAGNQNDLSWGTILDGPIDIERHVEQVGAGWQYRIRKSGIEAPLPLPYP